MKNLEEIAREIEQDLDEKDTIREIALKSSRTILRLCTSAIWGIHRGDDVDEIMGEAREETSRLWGILTDQPELSYSGFVKNAFQELCEAFIIWSIAKNKPLPTPRELKVSNSTYLLGLGDVVGELRRFALDSLRKNEVEKASDYLDMMEEVYSVLMRFDYPHSLVPIKRKQDIARSLIEKTRGEVAVAIREKALEKKMMSLEKKL